jgi:surface polysaccharide O-acyltransferase-like enzyme
VSSVALAAPEVPAPLRADPRLSTAWISWLRVAAIAGVVAIHTAGSTAVQPDARHTTVGVVAIVLNRAFNFAVPLFVLVSGALVLDPARYPATDGAFLRKRAWRLVPAIVFWHLFYWLFRVVVLDQDVPPRTALEQTLNGTLYTALYFFWIVLGLTVVSPVLVAWLRQSTRRAAIVAGAVGMAIPILTQATVLLREAPLSWVETPWTWWIPYVGLYLMGWALRGVRLPAWATVVTLVVPVLVLGAVVYCFHRPGVPTWFGQLFGGYYSLGIQVCAVSVFLAVQQLVRPGGLLRAATGPRASRFARTVGDATLGIFGVHLAVLYASYHLPVVGGDAEAQTVQELVGRVLFVLVVSAVIAVVGRRIPVVRRVL